MKNKLKETIKRRPVIGIWSIIASPKLSEIFSLSGIDFIIFDKEHGHFSDQALEDAVRACESAGSSPLVRVSSVDLQKSQTALDTGSYGIIAPKINTRDDAIKLVKTSMFPPFGSRGFNPFTRAGNFNNKIRESSNKLKKEFPLISGIVETEEGLSNLEEICSVDFLDIIYIGIYDLSVDLGFDGNTSNDQLKRIVKNSVKKVNKSGKYAGMMVSSRKEFDEAVKIGAKFIVYSVDSYLIKNIGNEINNLTK
jgi:4-hydroxy-2-oxoheptanedioate aldolase